MHRVISRKSRNKTYDQIIDEYVEKHPKMDGLIIKAQTKPKTKPSKKEHPIEEDDLELTFDIIDSITGEQI